MQGTASLDACAVLEVRQSGAVQHCKPGAQLSAQSVGNGIVDRGIMVQFPTVAMDLPPPRTVRVGSGAIQPRIEWYRGHSPWRKTGRGVKLTFRLHVRLRLRMGRSCTFTPPHSFIARCIMKDNVHQRQAA